MYIYISIEHPKTYHKYISLYYISILCDFIAFTHPHIFGPGLRHSFKVSVLKMLKIHRHVLKCNII